MIKITLKDGSTKEYPKGISVISIAKDISEGLARNVISASFNGRTLENSSEITENGKIEFYTWDDDEGKKAFWHSSSHVMAQAISELFPNIKLTIGPAITNGFYYDIDLEDHKISESDFSNIENRILEICREKHDFKIRSSSKKNAVEFYKNENNPYKLELINDLKDGEITFCDHSNFTDLCKGGHIPNTSLIKAVKIINISGAFWRADQNNKQLTRVYGISFPKQKLLKEYLQNIEQAKLRDHRKIGKNLKLFSFSNKVGLGLPLWLPKGVDLRYRLENFLRKAQKKAGYQMVMTPHIGNKELYVTSGHYDKYGEDTFQPIKTPKENEEFYLKPMNCPHHCEIYNSQKFSYKDLPVRYAEFGTVYRYEQSGELHGLTRVRGFTQDDAHIFCTEDQITEECLSVTNLILEIYKDLGFENVLLQFSDRPQKRVGDDKIWDKAESALLKAIKQSKLEYEINKGEGAFYGPKIDFVLRDTIGRDWQCGTLQVDLNLPSRLGASYISKDGSKKIPVMLHRALFGSLERFIGILIEHYAGKLPLWLAPLQVVVLPIASEFDDYAKKIFEQFTKVGINTEVDLKNQKINYKIREHSLSKVPLLLICGNKELKDQSVTIRRLGSEKQETLPLAKAIEMISKKNKFPIN